MSDFSLPIKLTYPEFCALYYQLEQTFEEVLLLRHRSAISDILLVEWYFGVFFRRFLRISESNKPHNSKYQLKVPVSVAITLWQKMQHDLLLNEQQSLLSQLDQQLTNIDFKPQMQ